MIKSLIASLHFKDHQHVKTYSSKISPRSRPVDLVDFIQTRLSTSLKISTCRLRSKLTCRLNLSTQLVENFIQTHLLTPLETSTFADFIQTHLSTQPVNFIQTQLVDFIQTQLVDFIQTHSSTLPETPRKSQLVDLVDSTRKSHSPIISKISTLVRCFKHPLKSQRLRSSRLVESLNLKVLPAVVELSPASLQNLTR